MQYRFFLFVIETRSSMNVSDVETIIYVNLWKLRQEDTSEFEVNLCCLQD